jgi:hypothetical protein
MAASPIPGIILDQRDRFIPQTIRQIFIPRLILHPGILKRREIAARGAAFVVPSDVDLIALIFRESCRVIVVVQMPLPDKRRSISPLPECLRHRDRFQREHSLGGSLQ